MAKLDRIEHTVTIPEGVTADISEDGVGGNAFRDGYGVFDSVEFCHVCSPQYT
jgi:hypothetical protein